MALRPRCARGGDFRVRVKRFLAADRCENDRRVEGRVQQGRGEIYLRRVDHPHCTQVDALKGSPIRAQGFVTVGTGSKVSVVRSRKHMLRNVMKVEDVQCRVRRLYQELGQMHGIQ